MRRPRAWSRKPRARTAPGLRPGALGPPARSSLTVEPAAWALAESAARSSRKAAATARRKAPHLRKEVCTKTTDAPDGAPSPSHLCGAGEDDGSPRAGQRIGDRKSTRLNSSHGYI